MSARIRAARELGEQAGLADPRLPHQLERCRRPPVEMREETVERAEFLGAADEVLGKLASLLAPP